MPDRVRTYVGRLPAVTKHGEPTIIDIVIHDALEAGAIDRWHREVQPWIKKEIPQRPDAGWNWSRIKSLVTSVGIMRSPKLFQVRLVHPDVPAAMIALLMEEQWVEQRSEILSAIFVWYMSTAPATYFQSSVGLKPKALGRAAIDIAITLALGQGRQGHLWLHADPGGGADLLKKYGVEWGFANVPVAVFPELPGFQWRLADFPPFRTRQNDGRYFCHLPTTAQWAYKSLNLWRGVQCQPL